MLFFLLCILYMLIFSWPPPSYFLLDVHCTYSIYVHCTKISNLCVRALETGRKVSLLQAFWLFCSKCKWILFLRTNVCILCLSWNIKQFKITDNIYEKSRDNNRAHCFHGCPLSGPHLDCYCLEPFVLHESGSSKVIFWSVTV